METPKPNDKGSFETELVLASDDWPYALPHLYAVNVVSDSGMVITGWTSSPDGEDVPRNTLSQSRSKAEVIGFWHGEYKITEAKIFPDLESAIKFAKNLSTSIPTKYFMQSGKVKEEHKNIKVTGDWPKTWNFSQIRDVGIFLCYLQTLLKERNEDDQAQKIKDSITPAWPPTEIVLVFRQSLQLAKKESSSSFDDKTRKLIDEAIQVTENWLKG